MGNEVSDEVGVVVGPVVAEVVGVVDWRWTGGVTFHS